jgi:hypothetical protein
MYHAHAHLEDDDDKEAIRHLVAAEARAQRGAVIAEIVHFHPHDQGQDRETDGGTTEGVTDLARNLPQATLLMTIEATGGLIFSRVAMRMMTAV